MRLMIAMSTTVIPTFETGHEEDATPDSWIPELSLPLCSGRGLQISGFGWGEER